MTYINFNVNQLTSIPDFIVKLTNLSQLALGPNQLTQIPDIIGKLKNLTGLYLQSNQLTTIPEFIGNLTKLTELSLHSNQITILPETIGNLTNLKKLLLDNNNLTTLPETIGLLTNLTELNLKNNKLTALPETIRKLTNLKSIALENNQFKVGAEIYVLPPKEQIEEILKWQEARQAGTLQPIHEAKVIFIGESNYGKTHLIELLREGEIKRKIKTTHGIERSQIIIPYKSKNIRLNIWDLGGQEFMRSTHQFFFSERTLYVLYIAT